MSATLICQAEPSPERRALIIPVLGTPRQTTDLALTHTRPPSTTNVSPIKTKRNISIVMAK